MSKWSREGIIRQLLDRESAGLPLHLAGEQGVESTLYQAASRIFGSWRNAVRAAGISSSQSNSHHYWSPPRVLAAIRLLSRRGHPLRADALRQRHHALVIAARRLFGNWKRAVVAAGIDPERLRPIPPWTRQTIVEAILIRAIKNEPLGSRSVTPRSLPRAGARVFGSWAAALASAGIDPGQLDGDAPHDIPVVNRDPLPLPTPSLGIATDDSVIAVSSDAPLVSSGRKLRWTDAVITQAIRARHRELRPMNAVAVDKDESNLYRAALRRFGSWRNALLAAGLLPDELRRSG